MGEAKEQSYRRAEYGKRPQELRLLDDMYYSALADRVRYFKETEGKEAVRIIRMESRAFKSRFARWRGLCSKESSRRRVPPYYHVKKGLDAGTYEQENF